MKAPSQAELRGLGAALVSAAVLAAVAVMSPAASAATTTVPAAGSPPARPAVAPAASVSGAEPEPSSVSEAGEGGPEEPMPSPADATPTARSSWVATVLLDSPEHGHPSASSPIVGTAPAVSVWGTPTQLLVLGERIEAGGVTWLRVMLDHRPNGYSVWVHAEDVIFTRDPWRLVVSRPHREVTVYRGGRRVRSFQAVVGAPSTPTPGGLFAIAAALRQPSASDFEGTWVLPLTAHSTVLRHFEGGEGQVALHGRGGASLLDPLGTADSHGCVRLADESIGWIATHIPVGTPVLID